LEQNYCQGYSCCGLDLNDLHGLLEHFEEHHVLGTSPAGTVIPPPATARTIRSNSNAPKKNLQYVELKRRANADLAQAQREQSARKLSNAAALDASAPFSMEDDLDMELEPEDVAPIEIQAVPAFPAGPPKQFSSALRHGLDALSIGSNPTAIGNSNFSQSLRRSTSPTASLSSPDISTPSTPLVESDFESDFDPSGSSASLHTMFAPMGTITPSMLFPPQFAAPLPDAAQDIDTDEEADPEEQAAYMSRRRQPAPSIPTGALPDFSKNQATIVMGSDPNMTTLNPLHGDGSATTQQFVAPPPTLPSGRAWVAPAAKPFKCPVPGCDKAYKQQNGLKYHRLHGHCNNRAREGSQTDGDDGRETLEEKPYGCYVGAGCGKRYKKCVRSDCGVAR
jgi:transcription factor SFP1